MKKRTKSLIAAIMRICVGVSVLTAVVIGGAALLSIRMLSETSYHTYETTMNEGYKTEIRSQVQSTMVLLPIFFDLKLL